jgi:hypothetical protein
MTRYSWSLLGAIIGASLATSCSRKTDAAALPKPTASGAAIVESSGGKQMTQTGGLLPQPVVIQVNDDQNNGIAGALVQFEAAPGVTFLRLRGYVRTGSDRLLQTNDGLCSGLFHPCRRSASSQAAPPVSFCHPASS